MSEVTKKSDTSSSQMRLLGGTPHMLYALDNIYCNFGADLGLEMLIECFHI